MLTKNFYSYMRAAFQKVSATFIKTNGATGDSSWSTSAIPIFAAMNKWTWPNQVISNGVAFGTGATPATVSDYFLEGILGGTQIDVSVPSAVSFSRVDTYDEYSVTFGITNKTAEAITISEVGLFATVNPNTSVSNVLVDRTVLDTPVTIPAGQSKQITYTIRFNYGDAV